MSCLLYAHLPQQIGLMAFPKDDGGGGMPREKPYSDHTAQIMDEEAKMMVTEAYEATVALITKYK